VAVVGMGLIGGSLGLALRRARPGISVRGYDPDPDVAAAARERGAATEVCDSLEAAVRGAPLTVVAAPVDRIPAVLEAVARVVDRDAAVTDVGSAKGAVVAAGEAVLGGAFVGGHPMAGSERHGIGAADASLFEGAAWVLTPTRATSSRAYSRVSAMGQAVGATPVAVDAAAHDTLVAALSHLPQLAASALVDLAASHADRRALLSLAGPGFRDVTRIAASDPDLWVTIIRANREAVLAALAGLRTKVSSLTGIVEAGRWEDLRTLLASARRARAELFAKPGIEAEPVTLSLLVPDRPGVLAEVTTAAGGLGANIEDLRIVHSPEGGRGRLELVVAGERAAEMLAAELAARGYHPEREALP
jgi:prephenate dehydrogenase